jgi:pyrroloquinoline quinone biosynthesis protein D
MNESPIIGPALRPVIERRFRLQWESAQNAHVLLYPEGMIKLNASAGEILKRCDGKATIAEITADLERVFAARGLSGEVISFVALAVKNQWLAVQP